MKVGIFYGSTLGTAESIAKTIARELETEAFDVANGIDDIKNFDSLILGTNTWGYGDLQDNWESVRSEFEKIDFSGKKVAIFSTGDGEGYPDTFVDSIAILGEIVEKNKGILIGFTELDTYNFNSSKAVKDGKFIGLPIDSDNQSSLTEERVKNWLEQIKGEF